ncbi:MAG: DUF2007 domain-containing protein [Planctomycetota bacterium]|nr:DUF2007 domain-containing protein [Planctomycetota bacterium]
MNSSDEELPLIDSKDLVEVYRTTDRSTADIIAAALRAEGIPCQIDGDHQAFSGVLNVKLYVAGKHTDHAVKFIESHDAAD